MHTAIYVRVSTEGQRTDSQEQELKRYCRQRGWKNPILYSDRISGARTSRPELNRLMQDIRGGRVRRLVVYKLDRLGRSLTHLALILDEINRLKVPLIASSQGRNRHFGGKPGWQSSTGSTHGGRRIRARDYP